MKKTLIFPLIFVGLWGVACGGGDGARRGNQAAYETVQEGSAAGVTSSIQGPGEALPPITGTNADTTTAFSLDPNVASAAPAPNVAPGGGTLAGTLPSQPAYPPPMTSASQPSQPQRTYTPPPQQQQPQRTYYPAQQPQRQQQQRSVEQPQQQQPPANDTVATQPQQQPQQPPVTNTQPQPATNTNPPAEEEEESEEAEEEPPPPPTTTDTRGQ
jgi:hypothetical protein